MFYGCEKLTTIYVSNKWNTDSVTDSENNENMFWGCSNLKGGSDMTCDGENNIDGEYARVDKDGQPGYLTGTYVVTAYDDITISPVNAIIFGAPYCVPGETITISPKDGYIITSVVVTAVPDPDA